MTNMVRCGTCRGLKEVAGIGGITRECWTCKGIGKVEKLELKKQDEIAVRQEIDNLTKDMFEVPYSEMCAAMDAEELIDISSVRHVSEVDISEKPVEKEPEIVHKVETCSLEDIFPGISEVAMQDVPSAKEPIFLGYDDEFMKGILAEGSMDTEAFKKAYPAIVETTDVKQRNDIRVMYAQSKPPKPRKVNLQAQQEATIQNDAEFKAFDAQYKKAQEKAKK